MTSLGQSRLLSQIYRCMCIDWPRIDGTNTPTNVGKAIVLEASSHDTHSFSRCAALSRAQTQRAGRPSKGALAEQQPEDSVWGRRGPPLHLVSLSFIPDSKIMLFVQHVLPSVCSSAFLLLTTLFLHFFAGLHGKHKEAEPLYNRSLVIRERPLGADHPAVATAVNNRDPCS